MTTTLTGHVIDNGRRPVANVKIARNGRTIGTSGSDGSFAVKLGNAAGRIAVTFSADGYVANTRILDTRGSRGNVVIIWPIAYRVRFDAGRDLDVELGSSRIQVPAGALEGPSGKKVGTTAALRFTLFDVTDPFQRAAAAGDFSSRLPDGKIQRLNSYGIFDIDLIDARGGRLSLRHEAKIDLAIAVPPKLARHAPRRVGFYGFDVSSGFWIGVGNFDFVPSSLTYNGSVTSFGGAHNLDDPQDTTCITVQVVDYFSGAAMAGFQVTAHGPQYDSYGTTDGNGFVCLLVQRNAAFTVSAFATIGNTYWGTPQPPTFTSPNFSSGAGDCGNADKCPFVGQVEVSFVVGGLLARPRELGLRLT